MLLQMNSNLNYEFKIMNYEEENEFFKERIGVTLMNGIRERVDYMIKLTLNLTKIKANKKSAT